MSAALMEAVAEDLGAKIKALHNELLSIGRNTVERAIEIGGLLVQAKSQTKHGKWLPWLRDNIGFSRQTADNYMRLYHRREGLKLLNVGNLAEAYHQAQVGYGPPEGITREHWYSEAEIKSMAKSEAKRQAKEEEDRKRYEVEAVERQTRWAAKEAERAAEEEDRKNNPQKYVEKEKQNLRGWLRDDLITVLQEALENDTPKELAIEVLENILAEMKADSFLDAFSLNPEGAEAGTGAESFLTTVNPPSG